MGWKTSDEDKMTLAEAYINFQIELKRKEIQEFQEEVIQLDAQKHRLKELREQLREEQMGHISLLRKQAKEQERKLEQREVVNKEQVELALQQNLEMVRNQETELEGKLYTYSCKHRTSRKYLANVIQQILCI